jgi:HPt (histidine-containing phosphotransfer) domain-containing protein
MFQFDNSIDTVFIENMYENDYSYIQEIFGITLNSYESDAQTIEEKYRANDLDGTRKAIHKIKSAVGFTGMLLLQDKCQSLEKKCTSVSSVNEVDADIESLIDEIQKHRHILQNEYQRLKTFNSQLS